MGKTFFRVSIWLKAQEESVETAFEAISKLTDAELNIDSELEEEESERGKSAPSRDGPS
jgi:hypothetical protein